MHLVKLWPRSALRTWPTNQTLFGALCWAVRYLLGADWLQSALNELVERPGCLIISDALPFISSRGRETYLLPKPASWDLLGSMPASLRTGDIKDVKRCRWVTASALNAARAGDNRLEIVEGVICTQGEVEELRGQLPRRTGEPHATVNRLTGSTTRPGRLFFLDGWALPSAGGFYVLLGARGKWSEPVGGQGGLPVWQAALRFAAETGVGGKRTAGKGTYEPEPSGLPQEFAALEARGTWLLLGRALAVGGSPEVCLWPLPEGSLYHLAIDHGRIDSAGTAIESFKGPAVLLEAGSVLSEGQWAVAGGEVPDGWRACGTAFRAGSLPDGGKTVAFGVAPCMPLP
ncbi:MAG: hypothetical protein H5T86_01800 [Armatimonadetes bacterium]|nr:hypothetical protein [Armatimonadota bacterium]